MRIGNRTSAKPQNGSFFVNRGDDSFELLIEPVLDFSEFDKVCPEPPIPTKTSRTGEITIDTRGKAMQRTIKYGRLKAQYMIIKGLLINEGFEWETVDLSNPETYQNYEKELLEFGLTPGEITLLSIEVNRVNGNDAKFNEQARSAFLASKEEDSQSPSSSDELFFTLRGELVKESE